jgi:hypothetical protein
LELLCRAVRGAEGIHVLSIEKAVTQRFCVLWLVALHGFSFAVAAENCWEVRGISSSAFIAKFVLDPL